MLIYPGVPGCAGFTGSDMSRYDFFEVEVGGGFLMENFALGNKICKMQVSNMVIRFGIGFEFSIYLI